MPPRQLDRRPGWLLARVLSLAWGLPLWAPLSACAANTGLTSLQPIPLRDGSNTVLHFAPDGRVGLIVAAHRGSAPARSDVYVVLLPSALPGEGWNVVSLNPGPTLQSNGKTDPQDTVVAEQDGKPGFRAVRFVRGKMDGIPQTFLLTAMKDSEGSSGATFDIYRLREGTRSGGEQFVMVREFRSSSRYCSASTALTREFGLPADESDGGC